MKDLGNINNAKFNNKSHNSINDLLDTKKNFFIDAIARFCDKCGSPYTTNDLQIISENGLNAIIHFSCENCKSSHVANFVMPLGLASRVPVNTDLTADEIFDFSKENRVTIDDVLEIYQLLKENQHSKSV